MSAAIIHSFWATFLSIVLGFIGKMTFQHFQLQSRVPTISVHRPGKAPDARTGFLPGYQSLLPLALLQAAARESFWIAQQASLQKNSVNSYWLQRKTHLFPSAPDQPGCRPSHQAMQLPHFEPCPSCLRAFVTLCLCTLYCYCLKDLPFLSRHFPKQKRQAFLAEKI